MKMLRHVPSIADQVYEAIVEEICNGEIAPGEHLVQEALAERLGVSRQPVQQAMSLLKADGLVEQIGRRGLQVAPLDLGRMQNHYDIRAALDGLAASEAALRAAAAPNDAAEFERAANDILYRGEAAVAEGSVAEQVRLDVAFHAAIYEHSGNPLLARTAEPHWRFLRRAMAEVLRKGELPKEIWRQHRAIAEAILSGKADLAEDLIVAHDLDAARALTATLFPARGAE